MDDTLAILANSVFLGPIARQTHICLMSRVAAVTRGSWNVVLFKDQDPRGKLNQCTNVIGLNSQLLVNTHTHICNKTMSVYMKIQECVCFWTLKKIRKTKTVWVREILGCHKQTTRSSWDEWISQLCKRGSPTIFQGD